MSEGQENEENEEQEEDAQESGGSANGGFDTELEYRHEPENHPRET